MRYRHPHRGMVVSSNPSCHCQSISMSVFLCAFAHPQSKSRNCWRKFIGTSSRLNLSSPNSKNSLFYICTTCQSHYEQPLGKVITKTSETSGNTNYIFKTQAGPLVSNKCPQCDSNLHVSQNFLSTRHSLTQQSPRLLAPCGQALCTIQPSWVKSYRMWKRMKPSMVPSLAWEVCWLWQRRSVGWKIMPMGLTNMTTGIAKPLLFHPK